MWPYRRTSCPTNSRRRLRLSPIIVDLRRPTCISLAIFGEEKSMTHLFLTGTAGGCTPLVRMSFSIDDTKLWLRLMFIKPAPATSTCIKKKLKKQNFSFIIAREGWFLSSLSLHFWSHLLHEIILRYICHNWSSNLTRVAVDPLAFEYLWMVK